MPTSLCGAGALALTILSTTPAAANGRFPAANQFAFSPADTNVVVLRTTFGILISHDGGASWVWLCEGALGLSSASQEDPPLGITGGGSLVAGVSFALEVSPDLGCTWNVQGGALANRTIVDVAVRPDSPHSIVALQSSYELDAGAGVGRGYASQVFESVDDGATWSPVGSPLDPTMIPTTIDVAATDPQRLYVSGHRLATEAGPATASLFVSMDHGTHWTEQPLPPLDPASEAGVFIGAVDPTSADVVYLRSGQSALGTASSRLFVTSNAGASFQVAATLKGQMLGFALSPDGASVYIGGPSDGLLVAPSSSVASGSGFSPVDPSLVVQCLAAHGSDLWACSTDSGGFIAGVSSNAGSSFTPKLHLADVSTPIQCPTPDAAAAQCSGEPFAQLCHALGSCPALDAGSDGGDDSGNLPGPDAAGSGSSGGSVGNGSGSGSGSSGGSGNGSGGSSGSSGGGPGVSPSAGASSCGCSMIGGGSVAGLAAGSLVFAAAVARRRRRES
jgi:MYXO-CTERM domain-containing protein